MQHPTISAAVTAHTWKSLQLLKAASLILKVNPKALYCAVSLSNTGQVGLSSHTDMNFSVVIVFWDSVGFHLIHLKGQFTPLTTYSLNSRSNHIFLSGLFLPPSSRLSPPAALHFLRSVCLLVELFDR